MRKGMDFDVLEGFDLSWGLKRLLTERQMTQGDIMRATGLERGYVSKLVSGKIKGIHIRTALRLARTFGMTCEELVEYCSHDGVVK